MVNKIAGSALSGRKNVHKKHPTFRDTFLYKLKKMSTGEPIFINSKILRESLEWDEIRYNRVKEQLRDENLIVVGRGGPGGAVAIANSSEGLRVFISYCHADEALKNELLKHLDPLNSPVKKSRFGQATSDATAMISAATSASNTATITTVIASAV
jgi:hypothetical protein